MFGRILLEGVVGKEACSSVGADFAFALGQRIGRRTHYIATQLKIMEWMAAREWGPLREWLLKDLPGEEPLPSMNPER